MKGKIIFLVIIFVLGFFVLQKIGWLGTPGEISKQDAIKAASLMLIGKPAFENNVPTTVEKVDGFFMVTFTFPVPESRSGETYHSFAKVDVKTAEVVEFGVEEDPLKETTPSEKFRPSPLNEEVDEVLELQKRFKH